MTTLSKSRAQEIIGLHDGIVQSMRRSVADAIRIGELLTEAKADPQISGKFLAWIESELPFSVDTAERYQGLFEHNDKIRNARNLQDAYRKVEQLEDQTRQEERQRKDRLIAEKQATGRKPEGWDRSLDYEEKKRRADAEFNERLRIANEQKQARQERAQESPQEKSTLDEMIAVLLAAPPKHEDLKLDDMRANVSQGQMFTVLREYLDSFAGVSRQLEAVYNLMRYLKRVAIELQPKTQEAGA
jgi:hypothetical protein